MWIGCWRKECKDQLYASIVDMGDKWVPFATYHQVEVMAPNMQGLEIFVADRAEFFFEAFCNISDLAE
jgi:hypothetical protein